jgi:hypothetical protein
MTANDVIEAYVLDVMRRVPSKDRQDIGLELRGLLAEMLAERAAEGAKPANEAMALAMVRSFGAPADVAARYAVPGLVIIPAAQTRSFAVLALAGFGLQWALTLPQVFQGQPAGGLVVQRRPRRFLVARLHGHDGPGRQHAAPLPHHPARLGAAPC